MALTVIFVAALLVAALVLTSMSGSTGKDAVESYAQAWARADYRAMREQLAPSAASAFSADRLRTLDQRTRATATTTRVATGEPREVDDVTWEVPVRISTRVFGEIRANLRLPVDGDRRVRWAEHLTFPGVPAGASLTRETRMPSRATLQTRNGTALAQGVTRSSPLGAAAAAAVGSIGGIPPARARRFYELGYPDTARIGTSGLERIFESRLAGKPGGELRAGGRLIASSRPRKAAPVRTTIAADVQQAALAALGNRLGGVVAVKPESGEILGFAGIAFSGLQPPGSTFKIITLSGALENGTADLADQFEPAPSANLSGVEVENANREICGGTLLASFAESCNSVFAPLGAKLGAQKLVETAEAFGFNKRPSIPGAAMSRIPEAGELGDDLAVGSSAIGQGKVEASALQMATVAATIALRGRRPELTLDGRVLNEPAKTVQAVSEATARKVERAMLAVVNQGTGVLAAIPFGKVAGKTGTAELRATQECKAGEQPVPTTSTNPDGSTSTVPPVIDPGVRPCPAVDDPTDTDAWFASYAPAGAPRVAVGVLLVASGTGRDTAAPAARAVMLAALK